MHNTVEVTKNVHWVGGSDYRITRFENMFPLTNGVAYNSYLIMDEKTCLMDTVDNAITDLYLENIEHVLEGRQLDYVVINHMEPDHCGNIEAICKKYPDCQLVGNKKTFQFFEQFYNSDFSERYVFVEEGSSLSLGEHTLNFIMAPMVHWPEVMMVYESSQKLFFSADAFGAFGAISGSLFADEVNYEEAYLAEARRYYLNIVGKHGTPVQNLFKKTKELDIQMILPLHGVLYRTAEDIKMICDKYQTWSTYQPEEKGCVLVYASMYGNTENVMNKLGTLLAKRGVENIKMYDVSATDPSYIITDLHRYSHAVFGLLTYNTELYLNMDHVLRDAVGTGYQNRAVSFLVNQSWGGKALQIAQDILSKSKGLETVGEPFYIKSSLKEEQLPELEALADQISQHYHEK